MSISEPESILTDYQGFTLMEIMVAVTIFGLVMIPLFSGFRAFLVSSQHIRNEVQSMKEFQDVVFRIRRDLEQIYVLPEERYAKPDSLAGQSSDPFGFRAIVENQDGRQFSSVTFSSFAHALLGSQARPGVARMVYYVSPDSQGGYHLLRSDVLFPFPEENRFCYDPVLAVGVSRFDAIFIDGNGEEHQTWDSDTQEFGYTFPHGIRFTLGLEKQGHEKVYEFFVPLIAGRQESE